MVCLGLVVMCVPHCVVCVAGPVGLVKGAFSSRCPGVCHWVVWCGAACSVSLGSLVWAQVGSVCMGAIVAGVWGQ